MQTKQVVVNLKEYKELIETIAKVEYRKLSAGQGHLIEYLELVNIATQTLYTLLNSEISQFNTSYLTTAIKWAIRNEIRRRYKWYTLKHKQNNEEQEDLRAAVYKTILSIDEITTSESPIQLKDEGKNPEESMEFVELKSEIIAMIKKLPKRERDLIESKFYKNKKLKDLAIEFNMSPSRISRIIQSSLDKIKKELIKQNIV